MTRLLLAALLAAGCASSRPAAEPRGPAVVMFLVDGMMGDAVDTAVAAGASNLAFVLASGVRVREARSTSPAAVIQLPPEAPGGPNPWGRASSGNVAVHTGCHLFESSDMDDIFRAAHAAGIRSVFSGGDDNYAVFTTADFHYGMRMEDADAVQHAIDHLRNDQARLLRVHLQRVRDFWTGPQDKRDPASAYIKHLLEVDALLGKLITALKEVGVWDRTYLIVAADHGMNEAAASAHVPTDPSSWRPFLAFVGPDLKKGASIAYAELPDVAVTAARFLGLPPLRGHLDPRVTLAVKGPTGTVLGNLFVGAPDDLVHPHLIDRCLALGAACMGTSDDFAPYRQSMLGLLAP
jgi:hypothetical protein